ncbi:hypothetical protein [Paenibacillus alvei]|uniref:Uncharacterized protein n=1 Tax=Paenibacillus alvei TaxID=44250 RepID=A0A383RL58_PAEAL|nr:hypothetical protein [Paenibacillus alvei]SYX87710.1 protein of unknown function [Paenibacillus alvei]
MDKWKAIFVSAGAVVVPAFEFMYGQGEAVATIMTALLVFHHHGLDIRHESGQAR